jgi:hypothetical protein
MPKDRDRTVIALDAETLQIGPTDKVRRVPIDDVLGTSRGREPSIFADARESWCVSYVDRSTERGHAALAVALLEPADADELDRRLAIRIQARHHDDPRALPALEAHLEAGDGAIGARLSGTRWRAVYSVDELRELGAHPFREGATAIPVCVRSEVWDALKSASPDLAERLEPVVVLS